MNINPEQLGDMLFVADIMSLAHEISGKDHNRIKRLLANKDDIDSPLKPSDRIKDDIAPRIIATFVIMEFVIQQLKSIVPSIDLIQDTNNKLIAKLPDGRRQEVEALTEELRKILNK